MKLKEFVRVLNKLNPNVILKQGNLYYYSSEKYNKESILNYFCDIYKFEDLRKKDLRKVKELILWGAE